MDVIDAKLYISNAYDTKYFKRIVALILTVSWVIVIIFLKVARL